MLKRLLNFHHLPWTGLILILVLLVAAFFRFYNLSTIPYGLNNDAAWEGSAALDIIRGSIEPYFPYAAEGWRGEGIIRVVVASLMLLFGNDPLTIKLASVIFGLGLIIPLFLLLKNLYNSKLALLTIFLVAISGWHITMSKTGWRAITVPFFATLTFYFFFRGLHSKKALDFLLSGLFLAIGSIYTYDAGRVLLLFFLFWLGITFITSQRFLKNYGKQLLLILISFLVISTPMTFYAINNWSNFTSRSEFMFVGHRIKEAGSLEPLWDNLKTTALLFNHQANGNDFFIFEPLADAPIAWFLPLGFLLILGRIIKHRHLADIFIVSWFIFSVLPGIISVPNGNRDIGAVPTVYFFAAFGLMSTSLYLTKLLGYLQKPLALALITIVCLVAAYLTYQDYLGSKRRELRGFYPETLVTTNYIKQIWDQYDIYLTDNYPRELLTYYLYRKDTAPFTKNYLWVENSGEFLKLSQNLRDLSSQATPRGKAFFMFAEPQNEVVADFLLQQFPGAKKGYLWYDNDSIHRKASLVVLIPNLE